MKKTILLLFLAVVLQHRAYPWGFYAHRLINRHAVFLLPPEMMLFFKPHMAYLEEQATAPDSRRYMVEGEGPRHYIDLDHYGPYPFHALPREWEKAVNAFGDDSLRAHGIVPWWIQTMQARLTEAFRNKDPARILKTAAELGHYIADAHVPLHTSSNHNGQKTNQRGIHAFWESRVPELLAENEWDLLTGKGAYIRDPHVYTWNLLLESAAAADTVLLSEALLNSRFPVHLKYAFEPRNGQLIRQYSEAYTRAYDRLLNGMVERRLCRSIHAVASFWITAWSNAGQPDLSGLAGFILPEAAKKEMEQLQQSWRSGASAGECR